jgi:hypothetical protein
MPEPTSTAEFRIVDLYPDGELDGFSISGEILEHGEYDLFDNSIYYVVRDSARAGRFRVTLSYESDSE